MARLVTKGVILKRVKREIVEAKVKRALDKLFADDLFLLQSDANERSISHKLAEYLQLEFAEWHVDCEYNRKGHDPKRLNLRVEQVDTANTQAKTVYPDIIVHHRNSDDNLLVIEIKKSTNPDDGEFDREKLEAFISQLGYKYGLFIKLITDIEHPDCEEFDFYEASI
jgi:hypothetical protein